MVRFCTVAVASAVFCCGLLMSFNFIFDLCADILVFSLDFVVPRYNLLNCFVSVPLQ